MGEIGLKLQFKASSLKQLGSNFKTRLRLLGHNWRISFDSNIFALQKLPSFKISRRTKHHNTNIKESINIIIIKEKTKRSLIDTRNESVVICWQLKVFQKQWKHFCIAVDDVVKLRKCPYSLIYIVWVMWQKDNINFYVISIVFTTLLVCVSHSRCIWVGGWNSLSLRLQLNDTHNDDDWLSVYKKKFCRTYKLFSHFSTCHDFFLFVFSLFYIFLFTFTWTLVMCPSKFCLSFVSTNTQRKVTFINLP